MTTITDEDKATADRERLLLDIQLADDFRNIMGSVGGRRWVWDLISECQAFQPIWHTDHGVMCMREGKRQVGLKLLRDINALCPDLYQVMLTENTTYRSEEI